VFRLVGTLNSKAGNGETGVVVRATYLCPNACSGSRWPFEALAGEVLPPEKVQPAKRRRAQAGQPLLPPADARPRRSVRSYSETVLSDLTSLHRHRGGGLLAAGERDQFMFCWSVALAGLRPPDVLLPEVLAAGHDLAGWSESTTRDRMSAVLKRAERASAGETITFEGRDVDPRYRLKASTIVERLGITMDEMRTANLRALISPHLRRERQRKRTRASRRAKGVQKRAVYAAQQYTAAADRAMAVLALLDRLGSTRAVADHLGISVAVTKMRLHQAHVLERLPAPER